MNSLLQPWFGLPYHPINALYRRRFGQKVFKVPVSTATSCPNREGLKGMQVCSFCDVWGSAARSESLDLPLKEQLDKYTKVVRTHHRAEAFLVYFQSYTSTFIETIKLTQAFHEAEHYPDVRGIVLGTRPDCLSPRLFELFSGVHQRRYMAVELGVQSFFNHHLEFLRRGHTIEQSLNAIWKLAEKTPCDIGIHLIFGLPGETDEEIIETALRVSELPIQNVKLHHLHVLKNTALADLYAHENLPVVTLEEYARKVKIFLEHLTPTIAVQRLAAYAPRWDELVAPLWTRDRMKTHQAIVDYLRETNAWQGKARIATDHPATIN